MRYIIAILVFCGGLAYGQGTTNFAATRPQDTSQTKGQLKMPAYAVADTNKVLGADASGRIVFRTKVPAGAGTGTVTSISQGRGIILTPNPLTTTGTAIVDTNEVVTYFYLFANYYTQSQTANLVNVRKLKSDSVNIDGYTTRRQTASDIHDSLNNLTAGTGISISGRVISNTAITDSAVFATVYGVDTAKVNIRAQIPSVSGLVPYTGATTNVDLGVHSINSTRLNSDTLEPNTSAGLHLHNTSHQDIFIAGAGGGQNLTIYAPTNLDLLKNQSTTDTVLTTNSTGTISKVGIGAIYVKVVADTTISANYTLTALDNRRTIHCTAGSNINLTIPTGLAVTFKCDVFQEGAGNVVFVASSTTLNFVPTGTTKTLKLGAGVYIGSFATANNFTVQGALQP